MSEKKFSKKHEWVSLKGDIATVGITKHATEMLGDIVFVEVPDAGKSLEKEGQAAVVESTKAASDVKSKFSEIGTLVQLEVRGKKYPAKICKLPFYKKSYVKGAN